MLSRFVQWGWISDLEDKGGARDGDGGYWGLDAGGHKGEGQRRGGWVGWAAAAVKGMRRG